MSEHSKVTPGPSDNIPYGKDLHFVIYSAVKRLIDFIAALFILLFAAIPMLAVALAVKLTSRGPAVFRQPRVGRNGELFNCLKFRSMYTDAPNSCASADLEKADAYITPVGNILRKTSLDELPQIINILKGEMSFIGPRPLIPEETYIHSERKRLGVYILRPGISGLAQVSGRDLVPPDEKVRFDSEYLKHIGLAQDIRTIFKTIFNVPREKDIHEGEL